MIKKFSEFINESHDVDNFVDIVDFYGKNNKVIKDNFIKLVSGFVDYTGLTIADAEEYSDENEALDSNWGDDFITYATTEGDFEESSFWNFIDVANIGSAVMSSELTRIIYSYLLTYNN